MGCSAPALPVPKVPETVKIAPESIAEKIEFLWAPGTIRELHSEDFEAIRKTEVPVFIDFYATWCGPCKEMTPIVDNVARVYSGKVSFGKVNIDEEKDIASEYGIKSFPTFLVLKDGEEKCRLVGSQPERRFRWEVEECLKSRRLK